MTSARTDTVEVLITRLPHGEGLPIPQRATAGSAGYDIASAEGGTLAFLERRLFKTGYRIAVPEGYECQLRPRSGLSRRGVVVAFGTVDADYRGELFVNMSAPGAEGGRFRLEQGDRIAQLVVAPVALAEVEEVTELADTDRGSGGFGSTGR